MDGILTTLEATGFDVWLAQIDIWAVICLVVGLVLIAAEAFIPGFGAFGLVGIGLLIAAALLQASTLWQALLYLVIVLALGAVLFIVLTRSIIRGRLSKSKVVLKEAADGTASPSPVSLVGAEGLTVTEMRPAGKARIQDMLYDVVSEGAFIEKNEKIVVTSVEGNRIVVRRLS